MVTKETLSSPAPCTQLRNNTNNMGNPTMLNDNVNESKEQQGNQMTNFVSANNEGASSSNDGMGKVVFETSPMREPSPSCQTYLACQDISHNHPNGIINNKDEHFHKAKEEFRKSISSFPGDFYR